MGLKLEEALDIPILAGKLSPFNPRMFWSVFGLFHNLHKMIATFRKSCEIKEVR